MKRAMVLASLVIFTASFGALPVVGAAAETAGVARVAEPLVKPAFTPLAPGAVEPSGWLRDWAMAARNGITGHLDEWEPIFGDGWKGIPIKGHPAPPNGVEWCTEQCSYWLDGLVRLAYALHDDMLIQKAKARLSLVVDGTNARGDSLVYWQRGKPYGINSWGHSHMGRALVAWYQATGDKRILDALVKAYAGYPAPLNDLGGLCNIDAALETYAFSGDRRVLDPILTAMRSPAKSEFQNTVRQWCEGQFVPVHAVYTNEFIRLPALVYPWTNEPRYLHASLGAFAWLEREHMLPYGVASGEEFLSGIGALRKTETCDVAASIWSTLWMYRILGERGYGDAIERAFFNAGPAPIARDFQTMCYYQSPNRLRSDSLPCVQPHSPGPSGNRFHRLSAPLCCVGAVNRTVPSYITYLWMATADRGLAAALYGPCTVSAVAGPGVPVKLTCTTAYPFEETIRVSVEPQSKASFPLYFRIPACCAKGSAAINRTPLDVTADKNGFLRISREWSSGDQIELRFPMPVRVERSYETEFPSAFPKYFSFEPAAVFIKRRLPYASVTLGPLLFALAIADQDPDTPAPGAQWQYALDMLAEKHGADITVERSPMPATWNWPLDAPLKLSVPAQAIDWKPTDAQALPDAPVAGKGPQTIRLVPYGCTKFRVSMFPVTVRAWTSNWAGSINP